LARDRNAVSSDKESGQDWDIVIQPRSRFFDIDLLEVWRYRDLVWMFFRRDFSTFYKQTVLGPIWYIIQPILTSLTYFFVFGAIANIPTDGVPPFLFYLSGIVVWSYFATCFTNNSEIFSKNAALFGKVYFPRLVVPISIALSGVVAFAIQFMLLVIATLLFQLWGAKVSFSLSSLALVPFVITYVAMLGIGVGLITSALTIRFRDLAYVAGFAVQLWMYASPVVYPLSQVPERFHWFFNINPMTAPLEALRSLAFGTAFPSSTLIACNLVLVLLILAAGLVLFSRAQSVAMDTV
jgi:lipopolysaccharide transport system permease protein